MRAGERGLAVVDVADGAHVDVRFLPFESVLGHSISLPALNASGLVRANLFKWLREHRTAANDV